MAVFRSHCNSAIFLVYWFSLGDGPFRDTVASTFDRMSIDNFHFVGAMESMVIPRCEIHNKLEEFVCLFIFEAIDEGRVMLFSLSCDQLAEGIPGSFDNLAFISCDLFEDQHFSIAGGGDGVGMLFWNRPCDFSGKEGAESRVLVEGKFYFFTVDPVKFGEAFVDGFSEHFGDSHLCNHLGLFCEGRF